MISMGFGSGLYNSIRIEGAQHLAELDLEGAGAGLKERSKCLLFFLWLLGTWNFGTVLMLLILTQNLGTLSKVKLVV